MSAPALNIPCGTIISTCSFFSYLIRNDPPAAGLAGNRFPVHFDLGGRHSAGPNSRRRLSGLWIGEIMNYACQQLRVPFLNKNTTARTGRTHTFLCRKHSDDQAERPLPHAVEDSHFDLEQGQGCDAVVSVNVSRRVSWRQNRLDPGAAAKWPERHDVAKVLSALLFLWNGLEREGGGGHRKVTPSTQTTVSSDWTIIKKVYKSKSRNSLFYVRQSIERVLSIFLHVQSI